MTSKEFNRRAKEIIVNTFGGVPGTYAGCLEGFNVTTSQGVLWIRSDPSPRIKVFSVFMRFTEPEKLLNRSEVPELGRTSTKWNIHLSNPKQVLWTMQERLFALQDLGPAESIRPGVSKDLTPEELKPAKYHNFKQ
jgi:hypothetical protein